MSQNIYYVDGYTIDSNPSKTGGGFRIVDQNNQLIVHKKISKENFTNNEAELLACLEASFLANIGDEIIVDSQNTLRWIKNPKSKKRADLMYYASTIKLIQYVKKLSIYWLPREENLAGIWNEKA